MSKDLSIEEQSASVKEEDNSSQHRRHTRARLQQFMLLFVAYMCYLLVRKNYGFWLPALAKDSGYAKSDVAILGTTYEIVYGVCQLLIGMVVDSGNPVIILASGLALSGVSNMCISTTSSITHLTAIWGLNGVFQSLGWPAVNKIFMSWYPDPSCRGAWFSLLSSCQNVGAALVPVVVTTSMAAFGWKGAFYVPAAISFLVGLVVLITVQNAPSSPRTSSSAGASNCQSTKNTSNNRSGSGNGLNAFWNNVVCNPSVWLTAANYFCISLMRAMLTDWTPVLLSETKDMNLGMAGQCLFVMELGGFIGTVAAGWASDTIFKGRRGPVLCICTALVIPLLFALLNVRSPMVLVGCYFLLGFCIFPVKVLIGLLSAEIVAPEMSSSASGFAKTISQLGGAMAGYPLAAVQQQYNWSAVFALLSGICFVGSLVMVPFWNFSPQNRQKQKAS